jgi:predicted nuclease of predicted toxin-antitoxin system
VKFLADMGVSMTTVDLLRQAGEAVVHLRDEGLHRLPDDRRRGGSNGWS